MIDAKAKSAPAEVSEDDFRAAFGGTRALIQNEWPDIDMVALEATGGDLDEITQLIAHSRERANLAIKKQLEALYRTGQQGARDPSNQHGFEDRLDAILQRLETHASVVAGRFRKDVLPLAETKAKENIWRTILIALGLGLVLGLFTRRVTPRG